MTRFRITILFFACGLLTMLYSDLQAQTALPQTGVSTNQIRNFVRQLKISGRIQSLQIIRGGSEPLISTATFSVDDGWQLFLFGASDKEGFSERWHSGKLPDTFRVSYPSALKTFHFGNEDGIEFQGCAPHSCPEVFSILLYVPSIHNEFILTNTFGKIAYSKNTLLSQNIRYKRALNQLLKEH